MEKLKNTTLVAMLLQSEAKCVQISQA